MSAGDRPAGGGAARPGDEFPAGASEFDDPAGRREFLRLMGASLALAGAGACTRQPLETIVPSVISPEERVPGRPLFYATAAILGGYATPILVESHLGRPTRVDGNPAHPARIGGVDVLTQASVLGLYDPDRSRVVTHRGAISTWTAFLAAVSERRPEWARRRGAGLRLLTGTLTSPTLAAQIDALLDAFPGARLHRHEPAAGDGARAAARLVFGQDVATHYRLERADVIVALDADFLNAGPARLAHARAFGERRRVRGGRRSMSRLYALESAVSATGASADHRLPLAPRAVEAAARALAAALGGGAPPADTPHGRFLAPLADDLRRHAGRSVVIPGDHHGPAVHAAAHALNHALGNAGSTVLHTRPLEAAFGDDDLVSLARALDAGEVDTLVILGGNPAYTAPAELRFGERLGRAGLTVHLGLHADETAALCEWHVPRAHDLESWGDARAHDGTVTIVQPLIAPLYGGRTPHEVLAALVETAVPSPYDTVRRFWRGRLGGGDFEAAWRRALHDGFVEGSAPAAVRLTPRPAAAPEIPARAPAAGADGVDIAFLPDPSVFDGSFANNGWLQELPKPITHLTWDNAVLLGTETARRGEIATGDVVEVGLGGRAVRGAALIVPGHAEGAVTLHLGYGRTRAGRVGDGAGFSAYLIRPADGPGTAAGATLRRTGERRPLARTQEHHRMEGRDLVRAATLEEYRRDPGFARHGAAHGAAVPDPEAGAGGAGRDPGRIGLYPRWPYEGPAWGMVIDLTACIGCNACVIGCQAENNIPIVGRDQVERGREMHWIRVDTYFEGSAQAPAIHRQPVPCMHCETAPCEPVCPVAATAHSSEGLNQMIYNRCVGTRYCSNNCPYKVRRFNFLEYADPAPSLRLQRNPDVTVRSRGVMEKCTYCVQRINAARVEAARGDRPIRDGEVVTACQAACPTQAIVFGDLNDRTSAVARLKADPLDYALLPELNTAPRTTYLAQVRNPHPEIPRES